MVAELLGGGLLGGDNASKVKRAISWGRQRGTLMIGLRDGGRTLLKLL